MRDKCFINKVALVTGASRGLGHAIALHLGELGATLLGTATTQAGADKLTDDFKKAGITGIGLVLNVSDETSIASLFKYLDEEGKAPDILVNNAGITRDNLMLRMKDDEWHDVINTNLTSVFRLSKLVLKHMMKQRWGRIINISSVSASTGIAGQANYSAAKAGLIGFSKSLAKEIATRGVTVNVVAPGFIKSDMTDALDAKYQEMILQQIPMARQGEPNDIAATVAFLASPDANYITGQTIHVNGGMYMV